MVQVGVIPLFPFWESVPSNSRVAPQPLCPLCFSAVPNAKFAAALLQPVQMRNPIRVKVVAHKSKPLLGFANSPQQIESSLSRSVSLYLSLSLSLSLPLLLSGGSARNKLILHKHWWGQTRSTKPLGTAQKLAAHGVASEVMWF